MKTFLSILYKHLLEKKNMLSEMNEKKVSVLHRIRVIVTVMAIMTVAFGCSQSTAPKQKKFATGEEAVNAFIKALRENNKEDLLSILGNDADELISSGDEVADQQGRKMFVSSYDEQHKLDVASDKIILVIGKNDWPFPIPLVKQAGKWFFDTASGKEEIFNRRIGSNELEAIQVMLAIVDAQREYAMKDRDGDGLLNYAQKFRSDPNQKNGLYWETKEGDEASPLGPFIAKARQEGYSENKSSEEPQPYHGYYYRIITAQGSSAAGGAFDYIVNGKIIGGFAAVAYPSEYGNSGVMTFIVNHDGVVYQKDLGEDTENLAKAMKLFDPDKTWAKVQ